MVDDVAEHRADDARAVCRRRRDLVDRPGPIGQRQDVAHRLAGVQIEPGGGDLAARAAPDGHERKAIVEEVGPAKGQEAGMDVGPVEVGTGDHRALSERFRHRRQPPGGNGEGVDVEGHHRRGRCREHGDVQPEAVSDVDWQEQGPDIGPAPEEFPRPVLRGVVDDDHVDGFGGVALDGGEKDPQLRQRVVVHGDDGDTVPHRLATSHGPVHPHHPPEGVTAQSQVPPADPEPPEGTSAHAATGSVDARRWRALRSTSTLP